MALAQTYCDFAAGNDYKGATFTDGAWTAATHTLAKTGAFAATQVNHWLYLEPNGGASFTAGYFKVATVPDANSVTLATDPAVGNLTDVKCTQHDGTTTLPWRSVQGALDLITRDATNGDQVNIKAGTAQVNATSLALTTYGAPTGNAPLVIRGYTTAANDGGIGEIDCGGATMIAGTPDYLVLVDLECHTFGDDHGIYLDDYNIIFRCEVHKGASSPSSKNLIRLNNSNAVIGCYLHDAGEGTGAIGVYITGGSGYAADNYVVTENFGIQTNMAPGTAITRNIVKCTAVGCDGIRSLSSQRAESIVGNIVYNTTAGTGQGIYLAGTTIYSVATVENNIVVGFSGAGGVGIKSDSTAQLLGHNAFYNNTANYSIATNTIIDETANDVALTADPFTDAASGDFSLTAAAKTALAAKGFPTSYLGAAAGTVPNITIGAIQQALASSSGGGFPKIASLLGRTRM